MAKRKKPLTKQQNLLFVVFMVNQLEPYLHTREDRIFLRALTTFKKWVDNNKSVSSNELTKLISSLNRKPGYGSHTDVCGILIAIMKSDYTTSHLKYSNGYWSNLEEAIEMLRDETSCAIGSLVIEKAQRDQKAYLKELRNLDSNVFKWLTE